MFDCSNNMCDIHIVCHGRSERVRGFEFLRKEAAGRKARAAALLLLCCPSPSSPTLTPATTTATPLVGRQLTRKERKRKVSSTAQHSWHTQQARQKWARNWSGAFHGDGPWCTVGKLFCSVQVHSVPPDRVLTGCRRCHAVEPLRPVLSVTSVSPHCR